VARGLPLPGAVARILIVDDEENQRRSLALGLAAEGFDCLEAESGEVALRAFRPELRIDVALVDLMMPGQSGLEVARRIRWLSPSTLVVLTSAYHLSVRQLQRSDCGAVGFVPKPYHLPDLCAFLRQKLSPASLRP
jgi:DNA-binding response OmpR family regulator